MTYRGGASYVALLERCRELRKTSTDAEALLWNLLRSRQMAGAKFRRQHQFGPYILDFYCHDRKLGVEVDGGHHAVAPQAERDAEKEAMLQEHGVRVLRFTNREVLEETESVLERIWNVATTPSGTPSP